MTSVFIHTTLQQNTLLISATKNPFQYFSKKAEVKILPSVEKKVYNTGIPRQSPIQVLTKYSQAVTHPSSNDTNGKTVPLVSFKYYLGDTKSSALLIRNHACTHLCLGNVCL